MDNIDRYQERIERVRLDRDKWREELRRKNNESMNRSSRQFEYGVNPEGEKYYLVKGEIFPVDEVTERETAYKEFIHKLFTPGANPLGQYFTFSLAGMFCGFVARYLLSITGYSNLYLLFIFLLLVFGCAFFQDASNYIPQSRLLTYLTAFFGGIAIGVCLK